MSGPFGTGPGNTFSFGQTPTTTQPSLFGANPATNATGFTFGSSSTFGAKPPPPTTQSTFSFSSAPQSTSAFGFGATQPPAAPSAGFGGGQTSTPFGPSSGLNFGSGSLFTTPSTPILGFGGIPATTATTTSVPTSAPTFGGFGTAAPAFAATPVASAAGGFTFGGLGTNPPTTSAPTFGGFGAVTTTSAPASVPSFGGFGTTAPPPLVPAVTPVASAGGGFTFGGLATTSANQLTGSSLFKTAPSNDSFGPKVTSLTAFGVPTTSVTTSIGGFGAFPATSVAFGTPTTTVPAPTVGGFGQNPISAPTVGGFGQNPTLAPTVGGFGQNPTSAPTVGAFGQTPISAPATTATPIYQFGAPQTAVTTTPLTLSTGGFAGLGSGIKLGTGVALTTTSAPTTTTIPTVVSTSAPLSGFSFPSLTKTTDTTTPALNLGISPSTTSVASSTGFSLASTGAGLVLPATAVTAPSLAVSTVTGSTTATTTSAVTTVVSSAAQPVTAGMNFRQLEETINKWTMDLEEQEKIYLNQATQVNAWDRMLIKNGEKITHLNDTLERVKLDQQHLEHEIDFILAQQKELEDLLKPLEQQMEQTPTVSVQQHADLEREHTYELAENIDSQMKRMAQDLKEIIDHVNASNNNQDNTDPVYQVGKILNAHMDSLQWIEQNTNLVQRKLEEVSQLYEVRRKDQERRFRLAYE